MKNRQKKKTGHAGNDRKINRARREILKKTAYAAPVIVASFFLSTAGAVPPSGCNPENCNPRISGCNPP